MKVVFKSTIFWCWIWALINENRFYNLELIEFKAYSGPTCISIPLSNLGWFFQKISLTYNLGDNIKNLLFSEKPLSPLINVVCKVLVSWLQNLARLIIDSGGYGGEFRISKIEPFLEFTWFSNFCLNKFCPWWSEIFET